MTLKEIKKINQDIYTLDSKISRDSKMMFIAALVFCSLNKDFRNPAKLNQVINFMSSENPISDIAALAKKELGKINLLPETFDAVIDSLKFIDGVNTQLYQADREQLQQFVFNFVTKIIPQLSAKDSLFFESLYMEVDKKAKNNDKGITLTPHFAAKLMIDLANLDYKKDIVADLCSGTGLFSILSFNTMMEQLEKDKSILKDEDYIFYKKRILNSIIANDADPKMVSLCLANFIVNDFNTNLIFKKDIFALQRSDIKRESDGSNEILNITKSILNPPYEKEYNPVGIIKKNIELMSNIDNSVEKKLIVILPPSRFSATKSTVIETYNILNLATLECVIKMQDNLFVESGQTPSTCIYVFNLSRPHDKSVNIKFYDFSDSGYMYFKDDGMVDKFDKHDEKKLSLFKSLKSDDFGKGTFVRTASNFYETDPELDIIGNIDPSLLLGTNSTNKDLSYQNMKIRKMMKKKNHILENDLLPKEENEAFEKHIIELLSED